jgi:hypothetical protein
MREPVGNNKGMILGNSKGKEVIVKTQICADRMEFRYGRAIAKAKILEPFCEVEVSRNTESLPEKHIFDNMKLAIKNLVRDEELEFAAGILALCEYVYALVIVPNGFLLHLELMPDNFLSFGVIHQNGTIMVAKQQGEWDMGQHDQEVIDICGNYFEALDRIIVESDATFAELVKDYSDKKLVN